VSIRDRLRGRRGRELLRPHEAAVLHAVAGALPAAGADLLWHQVSLTERIQRLFSATDVSLYPAAEQRGRRGPFSFPAEATELRLATVSLGAADGTTIRARVDAVYGIDTELGSLVVVGAVAEDLVVVRVNDGAVFRVSTDGGDERFGSIEAALSSGG
jgi:hypothetical protein